MEMAGSGVAFRDPGDVVWVKSRRSGADGNCVAPALPTDGQVAVRNSRDPQGPVLVCTRAELAAFVAGAKDGEFDAFTE
ncbi:DUF397 domain-containing protein [Streptomyces sp. NPDC059785]|uniref:DUF397 domain-containing protein n=1 Tax=Streptomyces sp. NPDC059785 TaxID=3346945 RepID=UPI0036486A35